MKKYIVAIIVILLTSTIMLSGCGEKKKASTAGEKKGEIILDSDVVSLVKSSFKRNEKTITDDLTDEKISVVKNIEINYLLKNIVKRDIKISVEAEFYNSEDELVGIVQGAREMTLPKGYTEKATNTPTNKIIYDGKNRDDVVRAVIIVNEL